ncbi:MAG: 50S ribosomal protein L9 [Flavobacteriales bacterium]
MEIILLQDVDKVGSQNDVVSVKPGYARNFLIPQGMAKMATKSALKMHAENTKQRAHKDAKIKENAQALAEKLGAISLSIGAKASENGKIFGSVNNIQIAEAINAKGFEIDRKHISLKDDTIKELGKYEVSVKLHKEVSVTVPFEVVAE